MPTLEVFLPAGHDEARKASLIAGLTYATVESIGAPIDSVRVILNELPQGHFAVGGQAVVAGSAGAAPVILAILIAGRTEAQKVALIAALNQASVTALESSLAATRVMIKDIPNTDFGLAGKTAKSMGR